MRGTEEHSGGLKRAERRLSRFPGSRFGNFKLSADCADRARLDFSMTGNTGDLVILGIEPDGVRAALTV